MHKKRCNKYSPHSNHKSFGIVHWFRSKGIDDEETMLEVMGWFCKEKNMPGFNAKVKQSEMVQFIQQRFDSFSSFAGRYLKENNYL
jgi:hypothetical protein